MIDLALQNRAKKHQQSVPRGLQEPLGTDVCFSRMLKLHFGRFWPPTWAQHGPRNRSKIAPNPTWPPKGRQEASKDPFWAQLEPILARFGANLGPKIAHKSTSSSRASSRWLPARWPALGAQPPVRSGHRAVHSSLLRVLRCSAVTKRSGVRGYISLSLI